jgi:hypothetical protein
MAALLRGRLAALGRLQYLEQRRCLVDPEHTAELAGRLQRRRATRLQRHHQSGPLGGGVVSAISSVRPRYRLGALAV